MGFTRVLESDRVKADRVNQLGDEIIEHENLTKAPKNNAEFTGVLKLNSADIGSAIGQNTSDLNAHKEDYASQADIKIRNIFSNKSNFENLTSYTASTWIDGFLFTPFSTGFIIKIVDGFRVLDGYYSDGNLDTRIKIPLIENHKYYISAFKKGGTRLTKMSGASEFVGVVDDATGWGTISSLFTAIINEDIEIRLGSTYKVTDYGYFKNVIAMDLTELFGAGYEPSKTDMDLLFSLITNAWVSGTYKPSQGMILNWTNLITKTMDFREEIINSRQGKSNLSENLTAIKSDVKASLYNIYARTVNFIVTKVGTTLTIAISRPSPTQLPRLYYLTPNAKYTAVNFEESEPYVLLTNEYLALDTVSGTIIKKNIVNYNNLPTERLLILNIDGYIVGGALKNKIIEDNIDNRINGLEVNSLSYKTLGKFISTSWLENSGAPNGSVCIGNEYWAFYASLDDNSNFAKCKRYSINQETFALTYLGEFEHNWGHVNTISYNSETDTLICGNGSGSTTLTGKIFILPNASLFKNMSQVTLADNAIIIDVNSLGWGAKVNVLWGEPNGLKNNIAYVITNDNENIRKILLGLGTTGLENGALIPGKSTNEFNGTFKVLNEYSQNDGVEVVQGGDFSSDGYIYLGLGHQGLWYVKQWLNTGGTINSEVTKLDFYNDDGTIAYGFTQSVNCYKDKLLIRIVNYDQYDQYVIAVDR